MRRRRAARSVRARMRRCVRVLRSRFGAGRPIRRVRRLGIPALTPVYCRPRTPLHQAGAYSGLVLVGLLRGMGTAIVAGAHRWRAWFVLRLAAPHRRFVVCCACCPASPPRYLARARPHQAIVFAACGGLAGVHGPVGRHEFGWHCARRQVGRVLWLLPRALAAARMPASLPHHTCHWQAAAPKSIDPESDADQTTPTSPRRWHQLPKERHHAPLHAEPEE